MLFEMDRWVGKTAVVTGASSGIGAAIALQLADAGLNVVGIARRQYKVESLIKLVTGKGRIIPKTCDISKTEEILQAFTDIAAKFGGVDILINNAAILRSGTLIDPKMEDLREIVDTNILGVVACTKEAIRSMDDRKADGHIVNINSITGHAVPSNGAQVSLYISSKFALTATTEVTRRQLAARKAVNKIKITSLSPGLVKTNIFHKGAVTVGDQLFEDNPFLTSEDVASAVTYVIGTPRHVDVAELTLRAVGELF